MQLLLGDSLEMLRSIPDETVNTCVTSPPYWGLRDYGVEGQLGLEKTPEEYVEKMVRVFREVRRVLKPDGTLWLNLGDTYNSTGGHSDKHAGFQKGQGGVAKVTANRMAKGLKWKDLVGIPWRVAFALQADGWYLRQDIIWHKPNPMPESVRDRCTKSHEYIFLLSKSARYYFDSEAIKEPAKSAAEAKWSGDDNGLHSGRSWSGSGKSTRRFGSGNKERKQRPSSDTLSKGNQAGSIPWENQIMRNRRSVWTVTTKPFKGAHFATFPPDLIEPCVLAGSPAGGTVLDPFLGSGTTGMVARKHGREFIGIDLNPEYMEIAKRRIGVA